jgi:hypothetical protein
MVLVLSSAIYGRIHNYRCSCKNTYVFVYIAYIHIKYNRKFHSMFVIKVGQNLSFVTMGDFCHKCCL